MSKPYNPLIADLKERIDILKEENVRLAKAWREEIEAKKQLKKQLAEAQAQVKQLEKDHEPHD